jgi:hypothetical protein
MNPLNNMPLWPDVIDREDPLGAGHFRQTVPTYIPLPSPVAGTFVSACSRERLEILLKDAGRIRAQRVKSIRLAMGPTQPLRSPSIRTEVRRIFHRNYESPKVLRFSPC